jgi:hypothetical protein
MANPPPAFRRCAEDISLARAILEPQVVSGKDHDRHVAISPQHQVRGTNQALQRAGGHLRSLLIDDRKALGLPRQRDRLEDPNR